MLDVINYALDKLTDSKAFEALATEIMREFGYYNIKKLGGVADSGQDAIHIPFYQSDDTRIKTVFQYSLEKGSLAKIKRTLDRLKEESVEFQKFMYVTSVEISTTLSQQIKSEIRKQYAIDIELADRGDISTVLSDLKNGVFARYFPDMEKQVKMLYQDFQDRSPQREEALLRTTLILNYGEKTKQTFSSIYDCMVLSLLIGEKSNKLEYASIIDKLKESMPNLDYSEINLKDSLSRLEQNEKIRKEGSTYSLTENNDEVCVFMYEMQYKPLELITTEVVDTMRRSSSAAVSAKHIDTVVGNCKEVVVDYFRTYGTEVLNLEDDNNHMNNADVVKSLQQKASKNLPVGIGNLLISAIAEVFANPDDDIAAAIDSLIFTYMSAAILNLDPELKEVSAMRLHDKSFIVDTDVLVGCVVREHPKFESYTSVIECLVKAKCRVIIPMESILECVEHASYSTKTYNYFRDHLLSLPEEAIEDDVWNGFVQGYYYGITFGDVPEKTRYDKYLRNYYDAVNPVEYMISLVFDTLGNSVEIIPIDQLIKDISILPDDMEKLKNEIYTRLKERAKKSDYRTEEQNQNLALNDAKLYLSAYYLNKLVPYVNGKLLTQSYYLITNSNRTGYCAYKTGFRGKVISKLPLLASLLRKNCMDCISSKEFIGLLDNPFLTAAMNQCRNEINDLIKAGVILNGCSLTRLRFDLDQKLHDKITVIEKCLSAEDEHEAELLENQVIEILDEVDEMGYELVPAIGNLVKAYKNKVKVIEEKDRSLDRYKDTVEKFSARRQRYFDRIRKGEIS